MMFIVCKLRMNDTFTVGTPPHVHSTRVEAEKEAVRLATDISDAKGYYIFEAVAVARKVTQPVEVVECTREP